jgi:hypothetical protein
MTTSSSREPGRVRGSSGSTDQYPGPLGALLRAKLTVWLCIE